MNRHDDDPDPLSALRAQVEGLERELAARDAFIVAAAHELRNPVSPLLLHVQRMQASARGAESGQLSAEWVGDQLDAFSRRLNRFMSALNRILDVSRFRTGQIELLYEEVDLAEVAREVASSFERELAASRSALTLSLEPAVGLWDRMRLEQIVSNLVSNAIRYGNSAPIEVSVSCRERSAVLWVRDGGVGIDEASQARIFERFERAHSHRGGFGVGLWIVRQLCTAMGGSVSVQSRAGEGATFTVVLPRKEGEGCDDG